MVPPHGTGGELQAALEAALARTEADLLTGHAGNGPLTATTLGKLVGRGAARLTQEA